MRKQLKKGFVRGMSQQNVARIMIMATISLNDAKIRAARFA